MSCVINAASKLLKVSPEILKYEVGYKKEIIFPDLPPPLCYKPVLVEQLYPSFLRRGYTLVPFNFSPMAYQDEDHKYEYYKHNEIRLYKIIKSIPSGILCGFYENTSHAFYVSDCVINEVSDTENIKPLIYYGFLGLKDCNQINLWKEYAV